MKKCFYTPYITGVALFVFVFTFVFPGISFAEVLSSEEVVINTALESEVGGSSVVSEELDNSSPVVSNEEPSVSVVPENVAPSIENSLKENDSSNESEVGVSSENNTLGQGENIIEDLQAPGLDSATSSEDCGENSSEDCYEEDSDYTDEELALLNSDDSHDADLLKNFEGIVRQSNEYSCGPAALATLLTQMGYASSESQIEELAPPNVEVGVSIYALKMAAIGLGYETRVKKWTVAQMKERVNETGNPILIHDIKPNVGGHFSVLREFDNGQVVVSDTEAGNLTFSEEDFSKIITGYVLIVVEDFDDPLFFDLTGEVSDEEAMTITGKYVAVMVSALSEGGDAKKFAEVFNSCMAEALKIGNATKRQSARATCYENFENSLRKNLSIEELEEVMDGSESTYLTSKPTNQKQTYEWYESSPVYMELKKKIYDAEKVLVQITDSSKKEIDALNKKIASVNAKISPLKTKINSNNSLKSPFSTKLSSKQTLLATAEKSLGQVKLKLGDLEKSISSATTGLNKLSSATLKKMQNAEKNMATIKNSIRLKEKDLATKKSNLAVTEASIKATEATIKTKKLFRKNYTSEQSLLASLQVLKKKHLSDISQLEKDLVSLEIQLRENELAAKNPNLLLLNSANEQKRLKLEEKARYELQISFLKKEIADLEKAVKKYEDLNVPIQKEVDKYTAEVLQYSDQIKAWNKKVSDQKTVISGLNKELSAEMAFLDSMELSLQKDLNNYLDYYILYDLKDFTIASAIFTKDVGVSVVEAGKVCLSGTGFNGQGVGAKGRLQNCLDACGTVDISGPVAMACDMTNGAIYLFDGEKVMAGSYAIAIIPVAGLVTKKGMQVGSNLATETLQKEVKEAVKEASSSLVKTVLTKTVKDIPTFIDEVKRIRLGQYGTGKVYLLEGDKAVAKQVFDAQTKGWTENIHFNNERKIISMESPDKRYTLNYREFSSSAPESGVKSIEATIDVKDNQMVLNDGNLIEVKFVVLN